MKVRQHIPAFFDGFEPCEGEVHTLNELLDLAFVHRWRVSSDFARFSVSARYDDDLLMCELTNGKYFVVAYLRGADKHDIIRELPACDAI